MSFSSDRASLDALCNPIFADGFTIDVTFDDGELIARNLDGSAAVFNVASATSDSVCLVLRQNGAKAGVFLVLLQDDPDCLVVDCTDNATCNRFLDAWFAVADAPAPVERVAPSLSDIAAMTVRKPGGAS